MARSKGRLCLIQMLYYPVKNSNNRIKKMKFTGFHLLLCNLKARQLPKADHFCIIITVFLSPTHSTSKWSDLLFLHSSFSSVSISLTAKHLYVFKSLHILFTSSPLSFPSFHSELELSYWFFEILFFQTSKSNSSAQMNDKQRNQEYTSVVWII